MPSRIHHHAVRPAREQLSPRDWEQRYQEEQEKILDLCRRIAVHEQVVAVCPLCSASLRITDRPRLFDFRRPKGCFEYNFHRHPKWGAFLQALLSKPAVKPNVFAGKTVASGNELRCSFNAPLQPSSP
jgi:hypothetical protein